MGLIRNERRPKPECVNTNASTLWIQVKATSFFHTQCNGETCRSKPASSCRPHAAASHVRDDDHDSVQQASKRGVFHDRGNGKITLKKSA